MPGQLVRRLLLPCLFAAGIHGFSSSELPLSAAARRRISLETGDHDNSIILPQSLSRRQRQPLTVTHGVRTFLRRKLRRPQQPSQCEDQQHYQHAAPEEDTLSTSTSHSNTTTSLSIHRGPSFVTVSTTTATLAFSNHNNNHKTQPEEVYARTPLSQVLDDSSTTTTTTLSSTWGHQRHVRKRPRVVVPSLGLFDGSFSTALGAKGSSTTEQHHQPQSLTTTTTTTTTEQEQSTLEQPLYTLSPIPPGTRLTPLEQEFRDILEIFANYTQRDILSLRDERVRALFQGVAASAHEPAVYRAFEVLFEDLYPLRVAARVIYKKLQQLMQDSQRQRQDQVDLVVNETGLDATEVEATWLLFVSIATKVNKDAFLTVDQLRAAGFFGEIEQTLHPESVQQLLKKLDETKYGRIRFTDFVIDLNQCVELECSLERSCDPLAVLQNILESLQSHEHDMDDAAADSDNPKKRQYAQRYDEMLASFCDWKDLVPEGRGRRLDVVRGCFVGAENEEVVRALRICYVDYSGLRMAAELIFKLVKTFMATRQNKALNR
mmetsp:Transcript_21318/g.59038  ORF Transcript_21318/g.59038 Transcript_21318/m.59038 type:complete len:547 (+) Transcript_21318:273-1913(+)